MVRSLGNLSGESGDMGKRSRVIELVGLAGCGKTTMTRMILDQCPNVKLSSPPVTNRISYAPFFITNLTLLSKMLWSLSRDGDGELSRREIAWLALLKGWPKRIRNIANDHRGTILLEQGSIYYLTSLFLLGPDCFHTGQVEQYWKDTFSEWANILDICVFIDASNETLAQRINAREKDHVVKEKNFASVDEFLNQWREAYMETISILQSNNPELQVIKINNESLDVAQTAQLLISTLHLE